MIAAVFRSLLRFKRKITSTRFIRRIYLKMMNEESFWNFIPHEAMLADKTRIDSYYHAIQKYVNPGDVVIDLGTGTGILSFFAHYRHPKKIYAIDHSDIIEKARIIADWNGMSDIQFTQIHSKDFSLPEKADVIIQEQIGFGLFDENMIESVLDLRNRVLKSGGRILPGKFDLFIEPVRIKDEYHMPLIWEQNIHNISFQCLKEFQEKLENNHYIRRIKSYEVGNFLCEPEPLFSFDLETLSSVKELPSHLHSDKLVIRDDRLDGFCLYFRAIFDEEIILDTSPLRSGSSFSNWATFLYRVESVQLRKGDIIAFSLRVGSFHDRSTWDWSYQIQPDHQSGEIVN